MAKLGKLTKLKSAIKRFPSFSKRSNSSNNTLSRSNTSLSSTSSIAAAATAHGQNLRPVYVGQSRRRYLVSPDIIHHPVFQELVDRSAAASSGPEDGVVIACEVVLFEHLLWMLESEESQLGSMDEMVDFYACA